MNLLADLYRNKARDLQEQLFNLERELKSLDEGVVSSTTETLTDPWTMGAIGLLIGVDKATKKFQPSYPTPTSFIGHAEHEFTNFPVGRGILKMGKEGIKAAASPIQSSRAIGQAVSGAAKGVQRAVQSPAEAAKATGKGAANVLRFGTGVVAPLAAGHVTKELVQSGLDLTGIEELQSGLDKGNRPSAGDVISSGADWAAMQGTGQALGNLFAGRALGSGLATAAGLGAMAGAVSPFAIYAGSEGAYLPMKYWVNPKILKKYTDIDPEQPLVDFVSQQASDVAYWASGGEETYAKNPDIEKIYDKYDQMKSKTQKDIEKKSQEPATLPPF